MSEPLSAARLREIRERVEKATPGPFVPEWDSCDCHEPAQCSLVQHHWVSALRLPEPALTRPGDGEPKPWDYLYSALGEFTAETALFLAHARQDVPDLLAEVHRLRAQVADLAIRHDTQKARADQKANRTRGLMRYALRRSNELGEQRDTAYADRDFAMAEQLTFAIQEIRAVFKREHTEADVPFEEMDRLREENASLKSEVARLRASVDPVGGDRA